MKTFILHHCDDLDWVRRVHGPDAQVIAHEDYLPVLLGEAMPCFFNHNNYPVITDEAVSFLSHNWHRDEEGNDLSLDPELSIADAFATGLEITVAGVCREYFALKFWCDRYGCLQISCNEHPRLLDIARQFGDRVQIYNPGHRQSSLLSSLSERVLKPPLVDWRGNILRLLQTPFLSLLRMQTLALSNWTPLDKAWIVENARQPWKGAYLRKASRKSIAEAECRVPREFQAKFQPSWLAIVLQRIEVHWDDELLSVLSEAMVERYRLYRDYFVKIVALYTDMLVSYRPAELVLPSEAYEPHLVAAHLAKARGMRIALLVDGYPIVDSTKRIGKVSQAPVMVDRIYAAANQHQLRLLRNKPKGQEVIAVFPPVLDRHHLRGNTHKRYDAIIMTWIPNDLGIYGYNGSRPITLLEVLRVAEEAGLERLAIKIKTRSEKEWLLPLLEKTGYLHRVTILEGLYSEHVSHASRVIGGISSAVGETAYHGIPYYIYEPVANGYSSAQIKSAVIIAEGGVARTPAELRELLKRENGSVIADRTLLFGQDSRHADWSWDQSRELYTDWAAFWADQSGIKDTLQWRGFPLWWASNLITKDTAVDYAWYQELHNRLRGLPDKPVRPRADTAVYFGILKSLANNLCRWLLVRLLPVDVKRGDVGVWFLSLEYNLLDTRDGLYDRMYAQAFLDDEKYGFVSGFLIRLNLKKADFLSPWTWRRRIAGLTNKLQRNVVILDRHLYFHDIIEIHIALIRNYYLFKKFMKPLCRQGIRIGHAEFADILLVEMQKSFLSSIPWSLSTAVMFERWLQESEGDKTLVTYAETLAPMRSVYFVTRRHSTEHRWISIQHATVYKNKMGFYHRFSEFNRLSPDDMRLISSGPDYYFVHGPQCAKILAEFYPLKQIRTIGCLKYDRLHRLSDQDRLVVRQPGADRVLLLAPSVGDEEIILKMFSGLKELPGWRVMLSKHPAVNQKWIEEIIRRNKIAVVIEFDRSKSTIQLVEGASLVVCSYSSLALESYFLGVPSVRVFNPEQPPMVEDEPGIMYLTTQEDFLRALQNFAVDSSRDKVDGRIAQTLDYYFSHRDGMASLRFWENLRVLERSKHADLRQP